MLVDDLRRQADAGEPGLERWERALGGQGAEATGDPPMAPWEQLAQVLLLTNEFMFLE